jgi:hypothetical protein
MDYYIYEHLNPLTKELFYIGLGTGKRSMEFTSSKNILDKNKIKSDKGKNKPEGFQGKGYHPLEQYSLDGKYIKTFSNMKQIKEELNIKSSSLWAHLKGLTKYSGGFIWKSIKNKYIKNYE